MSYQYNPANQYGQSAENNYTTWMTYYNYYQNAGQQQPNFYPNNGYMLNPPPPVPGEDINPGNTYDSAVIAEARSRTISKTVNGRPRSPVQRILRCRLDDSDGVREYAEISSKRSYLRPKRFLPHANSNGGYSNFNSNNSSALVNITVGTQNDVVTTPSKDSLAHMHGIVAQAKTTVPANGTFVNNTLGIVAQAKTTVPAIRALVNNNLEIFAQAQPTVPQYQIQNTLPLVDETLENSAAEEQRENDLQMNEAKFYDRISDTEFTASWYKLKKKEEDGSEVICVVVEIIDGKKVYKVYGGYTAPDRSKELAFKEALKKLTVIEEEKERQKNEAAVKNQNVMQNTDVNEASPNPFMLGSVPLLLPNPLSATFKMTGYTGLEYSPPEDASGLQMFEDYGQPEYNQTRRHTSQSSTQPEPPGTEMAKEVYDPVNYQFRIDTRPNQPRPPGTENDTFSERRLNDNLGCHYDIPPGATVDRPSLGRGEYEKKFLETIKSLNYCHRCVQLPPKIFGVIEYFGFEIELWNISDPSTRLKITGAFKREDCQARESVYAMSLAKLEKMTKKKLPTNNCDWLSRISENNSTSSSSNANVNEPLRKIHLRPDWSWKSTSDDLSILSALPKTAKTYNFGRGTPKRKIPSRSPSPPGGGLDHRDWRWQL